MKKILVACATGVATSTTVISKLKKILDDHGYRGQYKIDQIKVTQAVGKADEADFLISTTVKPSNYQGDFVSGLSFLTGRGMEETQQQILDLMEK